VQTLHNEVKVLISLHRVWNRIWHLRPTQLITAIESPYTTTY